MDKNTQIRVYLGLGSNLGDREANLNKALALLREKLRTTKVSPFYETEPIGYTAQPRFLNTACEVLTDLPPSELFTFIKGIETEMGRTPSFRNAPRVLDIDILLYGDLILDTPELTIPHPRMTERAFVLAPLVDIASEVVHPVARKSIQVLLEEVKGREGVKVWRS